MKVIGPQVNWRRTKLYWVLASVAGYLCGYALYYLLLMLLGDRPYGSPPSDRFLTLSLGPVDGIIGRAPRVLWGNPSLPYSSLWYSALSCGFPLIGSSLRPSEVLPVLWRALSCSCWASSSYSLWLAIFLLRSYWE